MKAPPFAYVRATSLSDLFAQWSAAGPEARLLAGGRNSLPMAAIGIRRINSVSLSYIRIGDFMADNPDDVVAEKFCRLSTKSTRTKQECKDIFRELAQNNLDLMLKKLVELTGLTEDELTEIMLKSCPGCPE